MFSVCFSQTFTSSQKNVTKLVWVFCLGVSLLFMLLLSDEGAGRQKSPTSCSTGINVQRKSCIKLCVREIQIEYMGILVNVYCVCVSFLAVI